MHQVLSRISVVGPLTFTDSMPLSLALVDEYISLVPMTSPFVAFRTKYGLPFFAVSFSYLESEGQSAVS